MLIKGATSENWKRKNIGHLMEQLWSFAPTKKNLTKKKNWAELREFIISLGTSWNICYLTVVSLN
jgi:hypothetical protein